MPGLLTYRKRLPRLIGGMAVFCSLSGGWSAALSAAYGIPIDHAKITEVVNEVSILDPQAKKAVPAKSDAVFQVPEIMKTGADSRSEMVAEDQTITRVGANTLFSFEPRERAINLRQGSILFQSPSGLGGGTIRTASATASVLGTTIIVAATRDGGFKLLVLEGTGYVRMPDGRRITLQGGQLFVVPPHSQTPGPVLDFLLGDEVRSSLLVSGFRRPLPSWDKIRKQIIEQDQELAAGEYQSSTAIHGNTPDPNIRINEIQVLHGHLVLHER